MPKRQHSSETGWEADFNWEFCLYCQLTTTEQLRCPGTLEREGNDPASIYEKLAANIENFRKLDLLPIRLLLSENDYETNFKSLFLSNNA